jgi:hypothetical protein
MAMSKKYIERARIAFGLDPRPRDVALKSWEAKWGPSPNGAWHKSGSIKAVASGQVATKVVKPAPKPAPKSSEAMPGGASGSMVSDYWSSEEAKKTLW